jgi:hypothetical protein
MGQRDCGMCGCQGAGQAGGRLVIAVDGKAVRGARNREEKAPHLVAALAHGIGAVLGQVAAWPSACCAWTATPASPPLTATTPATRSGR